jgi:hypothetical protein
MARTIDDVYDKVVDVEMQLVAPISQRKRAAKSHLVSGKTTP